MSENEKDHLTWLREVLDGAIDMADVQVIEMVGDAALTRNFMVNSGLGAAVIGSLRMNALIRFLTIVAQVSPERSDQIKQWCRGMPSAEGLDLSPKKKGSS